MENRIPTIKQIAKQLNVSVSTVSRALHDHPSIGLRTKMQVQKLAKELQYEPNQTAILFKQRKKFTVGVVLPRFSEEFFSVAISGIEDFAISQKYHVIIGQSYDDVDREKQIIETMKANRVDGLIVSVAKNSTSLNHFESLKNFNIPVVFFDCIPEWNDAYTVSCDLKPGTLHALRYLVQNGHKKIALINGPSQLQASKQRKEYFIQGAQKNDLQIDPSLIVDTNLSKEEIRKALRYFLELKESPTAIMAFNDYVALEARQYLRSKAKSKKISFVSFAHLPICSYLDQSPLPSVEQFPYEQGYKAMELLFKILNKERILPEESHIILESQFILPESL